jgi:hypothetical protein
MRLTTFVTWSNAIGNCIAREIQLAVFLTDPELEPEVDVAFERPHCLLYTDGVTEAMNRERELFGIDRLLEYMREKPASSAKALIARINPAGQSHQVALIFAPSNMLPSSNEFSFSDVLQLQHAAHAKGASVARIQSDAFPPGKKLVESICSSS